MDELEDFDFEIDPETLDTVSDHSIDPGDDFTFKISESEMEGADSGSTSSLEDVLGSDRNIEPSLQEGFSLESSSDGEYDLTINPASETGPPIAEELDLDAPAVPEEKNLDQDTNIESSAEEVIGLETSPESGLELTINDDSGSNENQSPELSLESELDLNIDLAHEADTPIAEELEFGAEFELDAPVVPDEKNLDQDTNIESSPEKGIELETTTDSDLELSINDDSDNNENQSPELSIESEVDLSMFPSPKTEAALAQEINMEPEFELDISINPEEIPNIEEPAEPELELNFDAEPSVDLDISENINMEPEPEIDLAMDTIDLEPSAELGQEIDIEPEIPVSLEVDLEPDLELDLDAISEPELEIDIEIDVNPEPTIDLEPEIELELSVDDWEIPATLTPESTAPEIAKSPLPEADEGTSDPFFSAYLKMADSLDDEESDSLVDNAPSSSGDDTNDFLNEPRDHSGELEEIDLDEPLQQVPEPDQKKNIKINTVDNNSIKTANDDLPNMLKNTLDDSIHKEFVGISETVIQTVQDVVKEVTPEIVRGIIQDEIDKIKKMEET